MAHRSGNSEWKDYPDLSTLFTAARAENIEKAIDGLPSRDDIGMANVSAYYSEEAVGGFTGQNGRWTDLVVNNQGFVPLRILEGWVSRMTSAFRNQGFLSGGVSSDWGGGGFLDKDGRETDLVVNPDGTLKQSALERIAARMVPVLQSLGIGSGNVAEILQKTYSGPDWLFLGDSLTAANGIRNRFQQVYPTLTTRNMAVGGETTTTILARFGVWPFLMTPVGGVWPASGSVDVTFQSSYHTPGSSIWPLLQGDGASGQGGLWGTLAGGRWRLTLRYKDTTPPAASNLHSNNDIYQLTRDGSGAAVTASRAEPFIPEYGKARWGDAVFAWLGQNGPSDDATFAGFQALEQTLTKAGKKFIFATRTGIANTTWLDSEKRMFDRWGRRYINIRMFLLYEAMPLMGLTMTADDIADQNAGIIPRSLRTDAVHHTTAAQTAIADYLLIPRIKELELIS